MLTVFKLQGLEWKQHAYIIILRISSDKASNIPKRDVRFILLK